MVQEIRQIVLTKNELISALQAHNRMKPGFLPQGKVVSFMAVDHASILVLIETGEAANETRIVFNNEKLLQAVIRFCLENNIMLPRDGRKSVMVGEENVSLCISLEVETYINGGSPASLIIANAACM